MVMKIIIGVFVISIVGIVISYFCAEETDLPI